MRITFLLLAVIASVQFCNPRSVHAQPDVNISVSASVVSSVELVTVRSMSLAGILADNGVITVNPSTSANAGKMIAIGTPNKDIRISYLRTRELSHAQESSTLNFTYRVAGNTVDDQATAELLNDENRSFQLNDDGRFFIWIGGSVDISTAIPGSYQGEFTLEIEYI